jgi:hypothetical protein
MSPIMITRIWITGTYRRLRRVCAFQVRRAPKSSCTASLREEVQ